MGKNCPRCGMTFDRITKNHTNKCDLLPRPIEFVRLYLMCDMTLGEYSATYKSGQKFIRDRLEIGFVQLHGEDGKNRLKHVIERRRKNRLRELIPSVNHGNAEGRCVHCRILLNREESTRRLCAICSGAQPKTYSKHPDLDGYTFIGPGWR